MKEFGPHQWRDGDVEHFELGALIVPTSGHWRHELAAGVFALATQRAGCVLDGIPIRYGLLGQPHATDQAGVRVEWTSGPTAATVAHHLHDARDGTEIRWDHNAADRVLASFRIKPSVDDEGGTAGAAGWFALVTQRRDQVLDGVPVRYQLTGDNRTQVRIEWTDKPTAAYVARLLLSSPHPYEEAGGWIDWGQRDHAEIRMAGGTRLLLHSGDARSQRVRVPTRHAIAPT